MKHHLIPPFRSGPWTARTRPADARHVDGVAITARLATRADGTGAVLRLDNGRLAIIDGDSFAIGHALLLNQMFVNRRAAHAVAEGDKRWWSEVKAVLRAQSGSPRLLPPAVDVRSAAV